MYDFSRATKIVDVGGGEGGLVVQLLPEQKHLRTVLFDLPSVVAGARERFEQAGIADRCEIVAGSFFDTVPAGGDTYILASVINNWNNQRAEKILANCRAAMDRSARLLIIEGLHHAPIPASV